ncbi:MAG: hypothetical protein KDD89_08280, partial [Anaerolineales bacterium]|nr:hypothetical protein [Anaerolineales bacterium]
MGQSFNRLESVLQLEAKQGYKNTAVVGGIRQFVTFWVSQAREDAVDEADRAFVEQTAELLSEYAKLPGREARARAIDRLLEKLDQRRERLAKHYPVPTPPLPEPVASTHANKDAQTPAWAAEDNYEDEDEYEDEYDDDDLEDDEDDLEDAFEAPPLPPAVDLPDKAPNPAGLNQPVTVIHGVGPRIGELLGKLGASTVWDLLYLFPRRYDDYSTMKPINRLQYGEQVTVIGTVWEVRARRTRNNQTTIHAVVSDGSGKIQCTWFNQAWLINKLKSGLRIVLQGKVDKYLGRLVFNNPEWEMLSLDSLRTGTIVPIYPLTQGLGSHRMRQMMRGVIEEWAPCVPDPLPAEIRERQNLYSLPQAIYQNHLPASGEALVAARRRIIFDELFLLQLGMIGQRR